MTILICSPDYPPLRGGISRFSYSRAKHLAKRDNVKVLLRGSGRSKGGFENGRRRYSLGRLDLHNGHDIVIDALPLMLKEMPNLVYLIVGDGPERKRLQQSIVRLGSRHIWLLAEHASGRRNFQDQIYALLVLEIWQRLCVEGQPV